MPTWNWYGAPVYRFRDEQGRFVAYAQVREWGEASLAATTERVREAALSGMPSSDFEKLMRQQIKNEVARQYLLGIGGRNNLSPADYGAMGGVIADQYRYLEQMMAEYEAGNISVRELARRATMYINSTREAFNRAQTRVRGIPPLDMYPGDGRSCEGLTNCKCFLEFHWRKGRWEIYWRLGQTEQHCRLCPDHAAEWNPLIIEE